MIAARDRARRHRRARRGSTASAHARLGRIYGVAARPDFIAAVAALLGVLVFDTLPGLFIGIAVSLLLLLYRASRPHVAVLGRVPGDARPVRRRRPPSRTNEPVPGIVVLRVESGLFFANADAVRDAHPRRAPPSPDVTAVVLDAETMPFIDVTAATMLGELADDLEREGIRLVLARDIGQVRDLLGASEAGGVLRAYPTVEDAVARANGALARAASWSCASCARSRGRRARARSSRRRASSCRSRSGSGGRPRAAHGELVGRRAVRVELRERGLRGLAVEERDVQLRLVAARTGSPSITFASSAARAQHHGHVEAERCSIARSSCAHELRLPGAARGRRRCRSGCR